MDDPVFDSYKGFYKKASSWFLGTVIVLVIIAIIGVAFVAISKLKTREDDANTAETMTLPTDNAIDTQINGQDLFTESDDTNGTLNQDQQNGGMIINPDGSLGNTALPENELEL